MNSYTMSSRSCSISSNGSSGSLGSSPDISRLTTLLQSREPLAVLSSPESLQSRSRMCSPDGKGLSPDILKRIIEGHEESDIFAQCVDGRDYDERADMLANELTRFIKKGWVYLSAGY